MNTKLNLRWTDIRDSDTVVLSQNGKSWIVQRDDRAFVVNWSSFDAVQAHRFLEKRTNKGKETT